MIRARMTAINGENLRFESDGWSQVIEGAQGGLQVKADGSYRFTAADDSSHLNTDDYTFTVTDKDGDSATGTVTFDSQDMNEPSAEAGSGVVAKSNDQYELEECNNKLGALTKAIHIAEKL